MAKQAKRVRTRGGADVDLMVEVRPSGRHVEFEADDPTQAGEKLRHVVTVGAEDGAVPAAVLALDDAGFAAVVQGMVDGEAAKFAELVESRRRVAEALAQIS